MLKFILSTNLIMAIMLTMMKSPISSNLIILIQTMTLTMMINLINKTSWMSFMIFILYIGGLMIIFLYISSMAFNELNINKNYKLIFMCLMLSYFKLFMNMKNMIYENKFMFEGNFYLLNMFMMPNNIMIHMIMFILFFMLILTLIFPYLLSYHNNFM